MSPDQLLPSVEIQWKDRTWVMRRPEIETERLFRKHLERKAIGAVVGNADVFAVLGEAGLSIGIKAVTQECVGGVYAWQREGWAKAMADADNLTFLFWLILQQEIKQRDLLQFRTDTTPKNCLCMDEFFREKRQELILKWNVLTAENPKEKAAADVDLATWEAEQAALKAGAQRPTPPA